MSSYLTFEGTSDYLAATPALILTFTSSGSITAGRAVVFDAGSKAAVYQPSAVASGSLNPVGVALSTVATATEIPVLVWGFAKSLPCVNTTAVTPGYALNISGSGYWAATAGPASATNAGKIISGSGGYIYALVDCMNNI